MFIPEFRVPNVHSGLAANYPMHQSSSPFLSLSDTHHQLCSLFVQLANTRIHKARRVDSQSAIVAWRPRALVAVSAPRPTHENRSASPPLPPRLQRWRPVHIDDLNEAFAAPPTPTVGAAGLMPAATGTEFAMPPPPAGMAPVLAGAGRQSLLLQQQ